MTNNPRSLATCARRYGLATLLAGLMSLTVQSTVLAAELDTNGLMLLLNSHTPGKATFTETKHLAMLKNPIVSKGELLYEPPGKLTMITHSPQAEVMVVDQDTLTRQSHGKTVRIALDDYPEVAGIVKGIRGSLGGNRMVLDQYYHIKVSGSAALWQMQLTPKQSQVSRMIARLTISGSGPLIQAIDISQADGDSSHMSIKPVP